MQGNNAPTAVVSHALHPALQSLWLRLATPSRSTSEALLPRVRLLAAVQLVLLLATLLASVIQLYPILRGEPVAVASWLVSLAMAPLLVLAYYLTRRVGYWTAANFTVVIIGLSTFIAIASGRHSLSSDLLPLAYLALPVLLSGLLLSARSTLLVALFAVSAAVWLHSTAAGRELPTLLTTVLFVGSVSALMIVAAVLRQRDVAQIDHQSRALSRTLEEFEAAIDNLPTAVVLAAPNGAAAHWPILYGNPAAERLLGYSRAELASQTLATLLVGPMEPEARRAIAEELQAGVTVQFELPFQPAAGQAFPAEVSASPVSLGQRQLLLVMVRDVTQRKQAEQALRDANQKLTAWLAEQEQRNREVSLLNELGDLLSASLTPPEAYQVIGTILPQLFNRLPGSLAIITESRNAVETVVSWGGAETDAAVFAPEDCWALRRGRLHLVTDGQPGMACRHLGQPRPAACLCVPMMAHGETLGMLHLRAPGPEAAPVIGREAVQQLARAAADTLVLALANLKLRETLRLQSIRDPVTGLYNRRYLIETMEREVRRAERNESPLGVVMLDLDHFKTFNDTFGHDAGDALLREFGYYVQRHVRGSDIACRYGGEEFTLILPDTPREAVLQRAEDLRAGIQSLQVRHRGQLLGRVTFSAGVAIFPSHGVNAEALLHAADTALLRAKRAGRDRVLVFGD